MTEYEIWIPLSEDSIPHEALKGPSLSRLEPLWQEALREIGYAIPEHAKFFEIRKGVPSLNQSLITLVMSGASGPTQRHSRLRAFFKLAKHQWKIEKYLALPPQPSNLHRSRIRSLALGACQQALLMRLPTHSPELLAAWLIMPKSAPRGTRRTLLLLLKIQNERNSLSAAWQGFFDTTAMPPQIELVESQSPPQSLHWKGLSVFPGLVEGECWVEPECPNWNEEKDSASPPMAGLILIWRQARPEHVIHFNRARAVLFIEGGVLSHACSVARERGIPCVTALGRDFLKALQSRPEPRDLRVEVRVDSAQVTMT